MLVTDCQRPSSKVLKYDITGRRFGKLVVFEYDGFESNSHSSRWICHCDCGNICSVLRCNLIRKKKSTKSCGCTISKYANNQYINSKPLKSVK